jgi:hypothetical protein
VGHVPFLYVHDRGPTSPPHLRVAGLAGAGWYRTREEVVADTLSRRNVYTATLNGRCSELVVVRQNGNLQLSLKGKNGWQRLLRVQKLPATADLARR